MQSTSGRRGAIQAIAMGVAASVAGLAARPALAAAAEAPPLTPPGAASLDALVRRLAAAPRRRSFRTVPMILTEPAQWDHEALSEVLSYQPDTKQVWDMTDMAGPWRNLGLPHDLFKIAR